MSRMGYLRRARHERRPERAAQPDRGWRFVDTPIRTQATTDKAVEAPRREDRREDPRLKRSTTTGAIVGGVLGGVLGAVGGFLLGGVPGAVLGGLGGAALGGVVGHLLTGSSGPRLAKSHDTYTDSATQSTKDIRFDVGVPSGGRAGDYALVNWLKGFMKDGAGSYFTLQLYGSTVNANLSSFQVDSMDADPVYWSDTGGRWNYVSTPGGFYATDSPGPALSSEHGAEYALQFQMGLYRLADLPTTTTGTLSATPLAMVPWQYSVKVDSAGRFTHPTL